MAENREICEHVSQEPYASGKWLSLNKINYKDAYGKERTWEGVSRNTSVDTTQGRLDAVSVIPIYQKTLHKDCLICVRQYRPPMKTYTIEWPAGLIDSSEDAQTAALRELKEETGYTATVKHVSPVTALDPGVENCTMAFVTVEIDGDDPINHRPKQKLEADESSVEVLMIPIKDVIQTLNEYAGRGDVVDSRLYSYAIAYTQTTKEKKLERMLKLENC